jgi:hypothetical protein
MSVALLHGELQYGTVSTVARQTAQQNCSSHQIALRIKLLARKGLWAAVEHIVHRQPTSVQISVHA